MKKEGEVFSTDFYVVIPRRGNLNVYASEDMFGSKDPRTDLVTNINGDNTGVTVRFYDKKPDFDPNKSFCLKVSVPGTSDELRRMHDDFHRRRGFVVVEKENYRYGHAPLEPLKVEVKAQVMADGRELTAAEAKDAETKARAHDAKANQPHILKRIAARVERAVGGRDEAHGHQSHTHHGKVVR